MTALETMGHRDPHDVLARVFGFTSFRPQQQEIIAHVMSGHSACVLMPTGAGKSLCYQIPALCLDGVAVVVSPLIALMQDQVAALRELGVRAAALHSSLTPEDRQETFAALREGHLDLIYVAPERLMTDSLLACLDQCRLSLIAIDEAHCLSQWGHDFRPEYRLLHHLRERFPQVPCLAVTATADEPTRRDILKQLSLEKLFVSGFDRPNIRYEVGNKNKPVKQLLSFLKDREPGESGIVYCLSRKKTETLAGRLSQEGFTALPYHAGLDKALRQHHQDRFIREDGIIIVATIAFGMGIDKPDVRFVAHMDLPQSVEAYYQETGRAGRDGLPATAWMVYGLQDVVLRRKMIDGSGAPPAQKQIEHQKLTALLGYCEAASCRRQILLRYFGDESGPCGNCDICLNPPETVDGTIPAQKILSCVYRTGQMFGAHHIAAVLRGEETAAIEKHAHGKISTFGIGRDTDRKTWLSFIRQLTSRNFLRVDSEGYGGLQMTEEGVRFLKKKEEIRLRLPRAATETAKTVKTGAAARAEAEAALHSENDRALFAELKALRKTLAEERNLPPYVIFHDKTLIAMATARPTDHAAFGQIPGVGRSKLKKYADLFLPVISEARAAAPLIETV